MRMLAILSVAEVCIPGRPVPLLGLHLLVNEVKSVNMAREIAEQGETDVAVRSAECKAVSGATIEAERGQRT